MKFIAPMAAFALTGCSVFGPHVLPKTLGEEASNYGYVPLDPLAVNQVQADSCYPISRENVAVESIPLLESLPDLAVRFAVAELTTSGQLEFGPSKVTTKGSAYRAVLDYVNVDAVPVVFDVAKRVQAADGSVGMVALSYPLMPGMKIVGYEVHGISSNGKLLTDTERPLDPTGKFERVTFPIYVGVGLRLTADIRALEGGVNLSGLSVIGAAADGKALTGTMTVQTLGVSGKSIASALPLPSKLDQTTIEQSILAIGTSRAVIYSASATGEATITPRVVGLYSPVGSDPRLINAIYSELSGSRVSWPRPCRVKPAPAPTPKPTATPTP